MKDEKVGEPCSSPWTLPDVLVSTILWMPWLDRRFSRLWIWKWILAGGNGSREDPSNSGSLLVAICSYAVWVVQPTGFFLEADGQGTNEIVMTNLPRLSRLHWEHFRRIFEKIFQRLKDANQVLSLKKDHSFQTEVTYLHHTVSRDDAGVDLNKVQTIQQWLHPQYKDQLRSCLGFCMYYLRYILLFSNNAKPLTRLIKGRKKI